MTEAKSQAASSEPGPDPHEVFGQSLIGTKIGGRYVVDRVLGKGGMGLVLSAHYEDLDQKVAIKLMFPEHAANTTLAKRFLREAKVAAKVRSPNLVRVTDIGHLDSGVPYLVMELLAGHDLDHELAARGALPVEDAVDHILQTAQGLAELHVLGIVHRDLKPGNLFLAESATGREIKILDYGISKDSASGTSSLTVTDALIGTPSHMSPEQIKTPKEVDTRSDIWSLGVILYELLTRNLPYDLEGSTVGELFGLVLFSDPIPLRKRRPDLPEALEPVVMKCLRRDRNDRYASVAELAEALAPFARAESQHRVAAIAKVLSHTPSSPSLVAAKPVANEKATVVSGTAKVREVGEVIAPTGDNAVSTPEAVVARTAVAETADERAAISKSLATSSRPVVQPPPSSKKGLVVALGVGAVVLVGGIVMALKSSSPPPATGIVAGEQPTAPPSAVPSASAVPAPELVSTAIVVPSATASAPPSKTTRGPVVAATSPNSGSGKPLIVRTLPSTTAPPPQASAPPKSNDLILDRK